MAKYKISEWSSTSSNNTDISNINIAEGCSPANINNAIRTVMAQVKDLQAGTSGDTIPVTAGGTGSTTASAARTALGAAASGANSDITSLSGLTTTLSVAQGGTGATLVATASVARTSNVATIVTGSAHGLSINDVVNITGCTNTSFNVSTATVLSVPSSTSFTFSNSGSNVSTTTDTTGKVLNLSYINLTNNVTGTLAVNKGGTGNTSFAKNNLVVGNGTTALSTLAAGTNGNTLISTAGSTISNNSFVVGVQYTVLTLGTTTNAEWNTIAGTSGVTYAVGSVFTAAVTGAGSGDGTATENTWTSGTFTPAKLSTASGSAPSYSARAFVRFSGSGTAADVSGNYTHSATTATVTITAHGLSVNNRVYLNFTTGTGYTDGVYTVTSITDANTFVATGANSFTTSGAVTLQKQAIVNGKNVSFVSRIATSIFVINFTTPMATADAPTFVTSTGASSVNTTYPQDEYSVVVTVPASATIINVVTFE